MGANRMTADPPLTAWRMVRAKEWESARWECIDGRWIAIASGDGPDIGKVVLTDSTGRRELFRSFEAALSLATTWRTPPATMRPPK